MNHLHKYHCYLPPIHKPELLPESLKQAEKEWQKSRQKKPSLASIFWLLGAKNPNAWKNILLNHWLKNYCLRDPQWIHLFYPYYTHNQVFHKKYNKIPRQILLWNDTETRMFSLQTTLRWNLADHHTDRKDIIEPKKSWRTADQSVEGIIHQWGSVPEWSHLPIRFPFHLAEHWPTPWQMLFRSLIFSGCYPQQSMISIKPWNGWCWVYRWVQWCTKNLGKIQTNHIYPECTPQDPIQSNHIHNGIDIGWYILEFFAKNKKQFQKLQEIYYILFPEDQKLSETSYLFMDFVTNLTINEKENNLQTKIQENWQQEVPLYLYLPALWHSYATQDRSSQDILEEYNMHYREWEAQEAKPKKQEKPAEPQEHTSEEETILDWYIPQKQPKSIAYKEYQEEKQISYNEKWKEDKNESEDSDELDLDELDQWISNRSSKGEMGFEANPRTRNFVGNE